MTNLTVKDETDMIDQGVATALRIMANMLELCSNTSAYRIELDLTGIQALHVNYHQAVRQLDRVARKQIASEVLAAIFSLLGGLLDHDLEGLLTTQQGDSARARRLAARQFLYIIAKPLGRYRAIEGPENVLDELITGLLALHYGDATKIVTRDKRPTNTSFPYSLNRFRASVCHLHSMLVDGGMSKTDANDLVVATINVPWDTASRWVESAAQKLGPYEMSRIERRYEHAFGSLSPEERKAAVTGELNRLKNTRKTLTTKR